MKIGFFTDTYLPNVDGVVNAILSFRRELEKRGHKVFVYASGDEKTRRENTDPRARYYNSFSFPLYPQYKVAVFPFAAKKDAGKDGIEIAHCHGLASMGFASIKTARDLGLPLVGTFHTLIPQGAAAYVRSAWAKRMTWKIAWNAIRLFYEPFRVVTAPTMVIRALLEEHGVRNAVVVPNGVDTNRFNPGTGCGAVRKMLGLKGEKMVLIAGRLSFEKNVDVLIEAAKILKKRGKRAGRAKFVVTGEGPAKAFYEKTAREKNVSDMFVFTGFVPDRELPFYYAACDAFATASTFETQGMAVLEAMACGKPVVAANAMALPEIVWDESNGFLFTPFDARECAEKIEAALSLSKKDLKKFSSNARKTAEAYSVPRCTDKLLRVYEGVLKE